MKQKQLRYIGHHNKTFRFEDENGHQFNFQKSRKELIEDYGLLKDTNLNNWFVVTYFIDKSSTFDIHILSDLELHQ